MSRAVDERVAKLTLDNSGFKSKASESVGLLAKLASAFGKVKDVNMDKTANSLSKIKSESQGITMDNLKEALSTVTSRFSTLGIIATTALANIANRAIDAGATMLKALTLEPVMSGFSEYEEKMNAIQVVLSNTRGNNSLQDVNNTLDQLNTYADKTIYSFADMTKNLGTFTAAGVGLEQSAETIQGIGNLAAVSGSNTQQMSTAMYQLSQAMAAGKVNLQDWNSVVNANMGGTLFQDTLKETAKEMGRVVDESVPFRESLSDGWLTTDVLVASLAKFNDETTELGRNAIDAATKIRSFSQLVDTSKEALQSGWTTTWEKLIGDYEASGELWTNVGNTITSAIDKSSEARNNFIQGFVDLGGRQAIIDTIGNSFKALGQVVNIAKESFREIFPPMTAQRLYEIVDGIRNFTANLKLSETQVSQLKSVFKGFFSIFDIAITVIKNVGRGLLELIPDGLGSDILEVASRVGDLITNFAETIKASDGAAKGFKKFGDVVQVAYDGIKDFIGGVVYVFENFRSVVSAVADFLGPIIQTIVGWITELFASFTAQDVATVGVIGALYAAFKKFKDLGGGLTEVIDAVKDAISGASDGFKFFSDLGDSLSALTSAVKVGVLLGIAAAIVALAVAMKVIASMNVADISKSLGAIAAMMTMLNVALAALAKSSGGISNAISSAIVLPALATAILILAAALHVIASLEPAEMGQALFGMAAMITMVVVAMQAMGKIEGKIATSSLAMVALANAILILSHALENLSQINASSLGKALLALGVILLELAAFLKVVDKAKLNVGSAVGVAIISASILIMVEAIRQIADIDVGTLVKGLVTIGAILLEIGVFTKLTSGAQMMSASVGMVLIAAAINLLVGPIKKLGNMNVNQLTKGLLALGIVLGEIAIAMEVAKTGLAGAAGIALVAAAINLLVPPLKAMGSMTWEEIGKGLLTLAGALAIIAAAAYLLTPVAPTLIIFAAAVAAVGVAIALAGLGISAFALALGVLASLTADAIDSIIQALGHLIEGVISLMPQIAELFLTGLQTLADVIVGAIPMLADTMYRLVLGLLTAMRDHIPDIVTVGSEFVIALAGSIGDNAGPLVDAALKLVTDLINGLANGIRDNAETFIQAVKNLIEAILEVFIEGLEQILVVMFGWIPGVEEAVTGLGDKAKAALRDAYGVEDVAAIASDSTGAFVEGIASRVGDAQAAGNALGAGAKAGTEGLDLSPAGLTGGSQFAQGLNNQAGAARTSGTNVANSGKNAAGNVNFNPTGVNSGGQFSTGLGSKTGAARTSGTSLANAGKSGASSVDMSSAGSNFGSGFAQGISNAMGAVKSAAQSLANAAKSTLEGFLAIFSPSRVMIKDGQHFGEGFAIGIDSKGDRVATASEGLAEKSIEGMENVVKDMNSVLDDNLNLSPTITPTLDLNDLNNITDLSRSLKLAGNFSSYVAETGVDKDQLNASSKQYGNDVNSLFDKLMTKMDRMIESIVNIAAIGDREIVVQMNIDRKEFARVIATPVAQQQEFDNYVTNRINGRPV